MKNIFSQTNIKFRLTQALTAGTALLYWVIRYAQNPMKPHTTMLVMAAAIAVISEFSYQMGKVEERSKPKPIKY